MTGYLKLAVAYGLLFTGSRMLTGGYSAIYLLSRGISLQELAWLKGLQALVILVMDLPFGYLADKYSRKAAVIFGVACGAVWLGCWAHSPTVAWIYCGEIFNALSQASFNGAYDALLVDAYKCAKGRRADVTPFLGRVSQYNFLAMAAAGAIGAASGRTDSPLFWWIGAFLLAAQVLFLSPFLRSVPGSPGHPRARLSADISVVVGIVRTQHIKAFFLAAILSGTCYQLLLQYWQPIAAVSLGQSKGAVIYSALFVALLLVQASSGRIARQWLRKMPLLFSLLCVGLTGASAALFIALAEQSLTVVPVLLLLFFLMRWLGVLISSYLHNHVGSRYRATLASCISTVQRLALILTFSFVGSMIEAIGLSSIAIVGVGVHTLILMLRCGRCCRRSCNNNG